MMNLKKIVVATDFSEHGSKAVLYGTELATRFECDLHLIHVVEEPPVVYIEGGRLPELTADLKSEAIKQLDAIEVDVPGPGKVIRRVIDGYAFVDIVRYARDNAADLIVIGTHGRGAIAHMLIGSVAEKVVRKAPCPVMVVRDEEHDFVLP